MVDPSKGGPMPANEIRRPVRAAVIGTGSIASSAHMPAIAALDGAVSVVAATDVSPSALQDFCDRWNVPAAYPDLGPMLRQARPDLVIVCSPPARHRDHVVAALEAGAWVLCEKPPALSLAECDAIAAAEHPGGPYASIVFQQRFSSAADHVRHLVREQALGQPLVALCQTTWYRDDAYYAAPWRGTFASEGGGPTLGLGIHALDLLLHLLGDWDEVRAMHGRLAREVETDDVCAALVRLAGGAVATILTSALSPQQETRLRIDLRDATLQLTHLYGYGNDDWQLTPAPHLSGHDLLSAGWWPPTENRRVSHEGPYRALLDCMAAGVRPPGSGADGRRAMELITAIYRAAATGVPVRRGEIGPDDPFYASLGAQPVPSAVSGVPPVPA
jgi:predicted dehydrogenase